MKKIGRHAQGQCHGFTFIVKNAMQAKEIASERRRSLMTREVFVLNIKLFIIIAGFPLFAPGPPRT